MSTLANEQISYRYEPKEEDLGRVLEILVSTDFFYDYEVEVAVSLIKERLDKGIASGYEFVFVEDKGKTIAYSCFGLIACTKDSFDLYWIATHNDYRGKGIGKLLIAETESRIKASGGKKVYAETSSVPKYSPTRRFYEITGYYAEAVLKEFYNDDDDKVIFVKTLI